MIWALVREQLRSQRRYALTAGALLTVTVGIAVYGLFMSIAVVASADAVVSATRPVRDSESDIAIPAQMTHEELTAGLDEAIAKGTNAYASASVTAGLPGLGGFSGEVLSFYGTVDWTAMIVEGSAPASGEIVVAADWAADHNVSMGDTIRLEVGAWDEMGEYHPISVDHPLVVSGMARSSVATAGIQIATPAAYVAWEDAPLLDALADIAYYDSAGKMDGFDQTPQLGVFAAGNANWIWDDAVAGHPWGELGFSGSESSAMFFRVMTAIGVGALVIGTFAVAFALGRAQAQSRSKWVATVKAFGATRTHVMWASVLESTIIGAAAGVAGYALGAIAVGIHLRAIRATVEAAMLITPAWFAPALLGGAVALGLLLALIVGAIPAFWSARVTPAAALKPINDLSEAEVSRRVAVRPLVIAWLTSLAVGVYWTIFGLGGAAVLIGIVAEIVLVVGGVMLANEALRASLPWHGKRMSRSSRVVVLIAGDAIVARPRQFAISAFIATLATAALIATLGPQVAQHAWEEMSYGPGYVPDLSYAYAYISPPILFGAFGLATLVCVALSFATATVSARDAAAREALGASRLDSRLAAGLQYLVAQTHGIALGLCIGLLVAGFVLTTVIPNAYSVVDTWIGPFALLPCAVLAAGAVCAVTGAAIVGALAPRTVPLAKLEVAA